MECTGWIGFSFENILEDLIDFDWVFRKYFEYTDWIGFSFENILEDSIDYDWVFENIWNVQV